MRRALSGCCFSRELFVWKASPVLAALVSTGFYLLVFALLSADFTPTFPICAPLPFLSQSYL